MTSFHQLLPSLAGLLVPSSQVMSSTLQYVQNLLDSQHAANFVVAAYAIFYLIPHLKPWIVCWEYLFATVHVEESHNLYETILDWTSKRLVTSKNLKLVTMQDSERFRTEKHAHKAVDSSRKFHTSNLEYPTKVQPWYGTNWFCDEGSLFMVQHIRDRSASYARQGDEEKIVLRTPGFSVQPILDLISLIAASDKIGEQSIKIFSIRSKNARAFAGPWSQVCSQPIRPIQSIALDEQMKRSVLKEVSEFLQPDYARMCAEKGIPWRRGYLFHGEPGTGKTSFAMAIAGEFGIPVYIVPLQGSDIDDADLLRMFACLPPRCLVLLEDLDTIFFASSRAKSEKTLQAEAQEMAGKISLSGLLNAIDGVTSSEGRILLVTSNFPESLDEALIRPRRIDRTIHFPLITKVLAQQMFIHMYPDHRSDLVKQFVHIIPDGTLSPATVQGFLLENDITGNDAIARAQKHLQI